MNSKKTMNTEPNIVSEGFTNYVCVYACIQFYDDSSRMTLCVSVCHDDLSRMTIGIQVIILTKHLDWMSLLKT